jgi:hypothetical protein
MGAEACATAALAAASWAAVVPEDEPLCADVAAADVAVPPALVLDELDEPHPTIAAPMATSMQNFMTFTDLSPPVDLPIHRGRRPREPPLQIKGVMRLAYLPPEGICPRRVALAWCC